MSDIRTVTVTGRVGTAPEFKDVGNGLAEFSLAVEQYRGPNRDPDTAWYSCNLWGGKTKVAEYITVGMKLTVHGELTQSSWTDKDGKKRTGVHIDVGQLILPDRDKGQTGGERTRQASGKPAQDDEDDLPW